MRTRLRMKCPACGHWNRVPANKIFIEQPSPEPKVRVMIPMYEPLEIVKCKMRKTRSRAKRVDQNNEPQECLN